MVEGKRKGDLIRGLMLQAAEEQLSEMGGGLPRCCVRPPFALPEAEFLRRCTHCAECVHACPHHALHLLPARCGFLRSATPAMELCKHACHLCEDWPCVNACEVGALRTPEPGEIPRLGLLSVVTEHCLASTRQDCDACVTACPIEGAIYRGDDNKPIIDSGHCPGCGLCLESCVAEPKAIEVRFVA